jgi:hypothetical protein
VSTGVDANIHGRHIDRASSHPYSGSTQDPQSRGHSQSQEKRSTARHPCADGLLRLGDGHNESSCGKQDNESQPWWYGSEWGVEEGGVMSSKESRRMFKSIHFRWVAAYLLLSCHLASLGIAATSAEEKVFRTELTGKSGELAVSPDGGRLLFKTNNPEHGLRLLDLHTGKIIPIPMESGRIWEMPNWSHDGKQIVAISTAVRDNRYDYDDMQLILLDPTTWRYRTIALGDGVKIFPFFSPDGKSVYFFKGAKREGGKTPASRYDLHRIELATGQGQQLTHEEFYQVGRGDDNGKTVLFNATPRARSVQDAFSSNSDMVLFQYDESTSSINRLSIGGSGGIFFFTRPKRDRAGNLYFIAARSRPGGGNYLWFLVRAQSDGANPTLFVELPISMNFDIARKTGEIFVMDLQGAEIVFRRLSEIAAH